MSFEGHFHVFSHLFPEIISISQAENLSELHEASSSMDFFRRTVAALATGTKEEPTPPKNDEKRLKKVWNAPLKRRFEVKKRRRKGFKELRRAETQDRCCSVCMEEDLPLQKLAITPCAHAFCASFSTVFNTFLHTFQGENDEKRHVLKIS